MFKILDELIYDKYSNWLVTYNIPPKKEDYKEVLSLAFDMLYEKKSCDKKNIKCFCLSDFRLIMNGRDYTKYIQNYPDKGQEHKIY